MNKIYIVVGSITRAMHGNELLQQKGIKSTIKRNLSYSETAGCGYSLEIDAKYQDLALDVLKEGNVKVKDVIAV